MPRARKHPEYDLNELAARWRVSPRTIRRWLDRHLRNPSCPIQVGIFVSKLKNPNLTTLSALHAELSAIEAAEKP
jgi:DeoR/GlpR family transcriptional regulator of sugar metabolism